MKKRARIHKVRSDDFSNLYPYERNLRTMIDFSILRGIRVVLTTQPHSTGIRYGDRISHMIQCNAILQKLAKEYGNKIVFVDVDKAITGKMERVFQDLGHMNQEGITFKARLIGEAILFDYSNRMN